MSQDTNKEPQGADKEASEGAMSAEELLYRKKAGEPALQPEEKPGEKAGTEGGKGGGSVFERPFREGKEPEELPAGRKYVPTIEDRPRDRFMRLDEFMAMEFPPPEYIVDSVLQDGSTLLAGRPKAGKSTLAMNLAFDLASDAKDGQAHKALGARAHGPIGVCYLILEDRGGTAQRRFNEIKAERPLPKRLFVAKAWTRGEEARADLDEAIEELNFEAVDDTYRIGLVIVDTLVRVREQGTGKRSGTLYDIDSHEIQAWAKIGEQHSCSILLLTHTNKGAWEDVFDSIQGSHGVQGAVDTIALLARDPSTQEENARKLSFLGRDTDGTVHTALTFDASTNVYTVAGDAAEHQKNVERQRLYDAVKTLEEAGIKATPATVHEELVQAHNYSGTKHTVGQVLKKMSSDSISGVVGDGTRGYRINPLIP